MQGTGRHLAGLNGHSIEARESPQDEARRYSKHYDLMGFVSGRFMIHANVIEVAINGNVVHRSKSHMWQTGHSRNCSHGARSVDLP